MRKNRPSSFLFAATLCIALIAIIATDAAAENNVPSPSIVRPHPIMQHLEAELNYTMENLTTPDGIKTYYLNYTVYDEHQAVVVASLGAINQNYETHNRNLNIDLRVGNYNIDNTHQLRGGGPSHVSGSGNIPIPLENKPDAIRYMLWYYTDIEFKDAIRRLSKIKTNLKVKVEEEDQSDDFSREESYQHYERPVELEMNRTAWAERLRRISSIARDHPLIYNSSISVGTYAGNRFIVTSENTRLQTVQKRYRITITAGTKAEDGMDLTQSTNFNATSLTGLPGDRKIEEAFRKVIHQVLALRKAPLAEPYIGPAILRNRASAVFFHEIFGHRIEGHRQKDITEGQTFTKMVGQSVLPEFISVTDDPTKAHFNNIDLRGYYLFDDEGVKSTPVKLVVNGILKTFLMSRRPIDRFPKSNGHGRRQPGKAVVSRQANLIVESDKKVPFDQLRNLLIEECKRQDKPYGLLFEDISGGFTTTSRRGPQSFKVLPVVVYKIFADQRPDELIRGADIVGTPLTSFAKIMYTGNDSDVFNGTCGAESGWVPVSAVSPSILVSTIEIEKRIRNQSRPPILEPPLKDESTLGN